MGPPKHPTLIITRPSDGGGWTTEPICSEIGRRDSEILWTARRGELFTVQSTQTNETICDASGTVKREGPGSGRQQAFVKGHPERSPREKVGSVAIRGVSRVLDTP